MAWKLSVMTFSISAMPVSQRQRMPHRRTYLWLRLRVAICSPSMVKLFGGIFPLVSETHLPFSALNVILTPLISFARLYRAHFLSLARSKLRLCSANHRAGYFSNLACDWLSIVWAYSKQETENGPRRELFFFFFFFFFFFRCDNVHWGDFVGLLILPSYPSFPSVVYFGLLLQSSLWPSQTVHSIGILT